MPRLSPYLRGKRKKFGNEWGVGPVVTWTKRPTTMSIAQDEHNGIEFQVKINNINQSTSIPSTSSTFKFNSDNIYWYIKRPDRLASFLTSMSHDLEHNTSTLVLKKTSGDLMTTGTYRIYIGISTTANTGTSAITIPETNNVEPTELNDNVKNWKKLWPVTTPVWFDVAVA